MQAKTFGEYLRELRTKRNLTIRQVEKYSGVSNGYLSQVETGKRGIPSPEILRKIAPVLKVSYEELMKEAGYICDNDLESPSQNDTKTNSDFPLAAEIESLNEESKKELEKYVKLLKIKEEIDKSKAETSSSLAKDA